MKTYTMSETAKILNLPPRTIKQWEKDLQSIFQIPRTRQGARIFTDQEITFLQTVQQFYNENKTKQEIISFFTEQGDLHEVPGNTLPQSSGLQTVTFEGEIVDHSPKTVKEWEEEFLHRAKRELVGEMDDRITTKLNETVEAITSLFAESQTSVMEQVEKLTRETREELGKTTNHLEQVTADVQKLVENTSMQIENMATSIVEERKQFTDQLERERKLHHEKIMERERAFRELVLQYREAAASGVRKREKKWWKFWE